MGVLDLFRIDSKRVFISGGSRGLSPGDARGLSLEPFCQGSRCTTMQANKGNPS
jgi:hypothetical protein